MAEKYKGIINDIEEVNDNIKIFRVVLDKSISFIPGQFMLFGIEIDGKPLKRSFSICNTKNESYVEFCVKKYEKGRLSPLLFKLKKNDDVILEGPYGKFNYKETNKDLIFIAAGVGIAPLISMIRELIDKNVKNNITLFYGVREIKDFCFIKELEKLNKIKFIKILSKPDDKWKGEIGHVQDILEKYLKNLKNENFYICGPPEMVDDVVLKLKELDVKEEQINKEKW